MSEAPITSSIAVPRQEGLLTAAKSAVTPDEAHVIWLDRQEVYLSWAGILSALLLSLAFLGVSGWLISTNHDIGGTVLGTVDLGALVTVFVTGQRARKPGPKRNG